MNTSLTDSIRDYLTTQPVQKAWLFGSYSRNEERPDSDVDIIVRLMPDTTMGLKFFGMIVDLERILNRPVDMVVEGDLLPFAEESANRDKILIYERTH